MKKVLCFAMILCLVLAAVGCSPAATTGAETTAKETQSTETTEATTTEQATGEETLTFALHQNVKIHIMMLMESPF